MWRSFEKTLDRELAPAAQVQGGAPARDPWLRDWPLLLGLVAAAALIALSTTLGPPEARPAGAAPSKAATGAGAGAPGEVVDVGGSDVALDPAPAATARPHQAKKKPAGKRKVAASPEPAPDARSTAGGDAAEPAPASGGSATPRKRTTRRAPAAAAPAPPKQSRIVNVTGISATFTNGPMSYAFSAPTHTPVVGRRWRLSITAKRSGAPVAGNVKIDILHQGNVVGHVTSGKLSGGRFAHDLDWPDRSAGYPLTVKTTVGAGGFQQSFLFNVTVRKAA
jgi:hypothetical protein